LTGTAHELEILFIVILPGTGDVLTWLKLGTYQALWMELQQQHRVDPINRQLDQPTLF